jgi:hypothetical protein
MVQGSDGHSITSAAARSCGGCTACCDGWLRIEVYGVAVGPGHPCPHSTGQACAIHARRPLDPCQRFYCGWLLPDSPLPDWLRPDRARAILLAAQITWQGAPVDVVVPVGPSPSEDALRWFREFAARRGRLLLYRQDEDWFAFGPPAFQAGMQERIARGDRLW